MFDRKYEVNPHTLPILSRSTYIRLVISLKTKICHILPRKTVNDVVLEQISLFLVLKQLLLLERHFSFHLIKFVIFGYCFLRVEFMVGHVSVKLLVHFLDPIGYKYNAELILRVIDSSVLHHHIYIIHDASHGAYEFCLFFVIHCDTH